ncbi:hypothetical protein MBLNU459_g8057t1 [Dothideomycetes sp. NU459]
MAQPASDSTAPATTDTTASAPSTAPLPDPAPSPEMAASVSTPPRSRSSSASSFAASRGHSPNLSLDLKDLPALSQPAQPSNTLIITNLDDPLIFTAPNLAAIRSALDAADPLYSFSPLRSFRRIICAFYTVDAALKVRQTLDGESVLGHRIRVYFGQETKIVLPEDQHLKAPDTGRLFFISPPPSPPHGWESKHEDPPNKDVHADDLAAALHKLSARGGDADAMRIEEAEMADDLARAKKNTADMNRARSDSRTIVYHPVEQGHSALLPAIAVEDTSQPSSPVDPAFGAAEKPITHTARPPVELME